MIGMHAINALEGVCGLTGLDNIFCGCICIIGFFAYEVAVLCYIQTILYTSTHCASSDNPEATPTQYWWLLFNNIVYFALLIAMLALKIRGMCGSPDKDEVNKEVEQELKK